MDINKQIDYWTKGADNDIETAGVLFKSNKNIEGLFFCHLSIEKILKALVVKQTEQFAPKSHNLNYLSELAKFNLTDEQAMFMSVLMKYQLEGRYPEYYPKSPSSEIINDYYNKTKILLECLKTKL